MADIFQAMAQNRPYRTGMSADQILAFLNELVAKGRLDGQIVAVVGADMQNAMVAALPGTVVVG